jgi:EAL domain-containing protein (putative c-di-GMP-specific phosphodiesterase class I)
MMLPGDFIGVAEETGLIHAIGRWVLHEACRQACVWREELGPNAPRVVAVNVSGRQFESPGVVTDVEAALRASGLPPEALELELTESVLMRDPVNARERIRAIRALGVSIAIDDFGTGYSALALLRKLPVDVLKIDRCFVEGVAHRPDQAAFVGAIAALAKSLRLRTVAEGIETREELECLLRLGCDRGQGYLFSAPRLATELFGARRARTPSGRWSAEVVETRYSARAECVRSESP